MLFAVFVTAVSIPCSGVLLLLLVVLLGDGVSRSLLCLTINDILDWHRVKHTARSFGARLTSRSRPITVLSGAYCLCCFPLSFLKSRLLLSILSNSAAVIRVLTKQILVGARFISVSASPYKSKDSVDLNQDEHLNPQPQMACWCSWLSRLLNTHKVSG